MYREDIEQAQQQLASDKLGLVSLEQRCRRIDGKYPNWLVPLKPVTTIINRTVYRWLPQFPSVGVSEQGGYVRVLKSGVSLSGPGAITVRAYDTVAGRVCRVAMHLLVAVAWLPRVDYVNHNRLVFIDGDRAHVPAANLRWGKRSEVAINGGATDGYMLVGFDGIRHHYHNLTDVAKHTGTERKRSEQLPCIIYHDNTPMLLCDASHTSPLDTLHDMYYVHKVYDTVNHTYKEFHALKDISRYYGFHKGNPSATIIKRLLAKRSLELISKVPLGRRRYDCYNHVDNVEYTHVTFKDLMRLAGGTKSEVNSRTDPNKSYGLPLNGWYIKRHGSGEYVKRSKQQPKAVRVTSSNSVRVLATIKGCTDVYGWAYNTIVSHIKSGKLLDGYLLEYVDT